jgi:hypothetical protein
VTDDRYHGEDEHDEREVPLPAVPGLGLIVIEAEFVFGRLEAVLDRPAVAFNPDQGGDVRSGWPSGREGEIAVSKIAADEQAACPLASSSFASSTVRSDLIDRAQGWRRAFRRRRSRAS